MILDVDNINDNTFFKMRRHLDALKDKTEEPIELINMLMIEANSLITLLDSKINKDDIAGLKYHNHEVVTAHMSERGLLQETEKAWKQFYDTEVLAKNLIALVNNYKARLSCALVYKPFFDEIQPLLRNLTSLKKQFDKAASLEKNISKMQERIDFLEEENVRMKHDQDSFDNISEKYRKRFKEILLDRRRMEYMMKVINEKVDPHENAALVKVCFWLMMEGDTLLADIYKKVTSHKEMAYLIKEYSHLFKIKKNKILSLRLEGVGWEKVELLIQKEIENLEDGR